MTPEFTSEPVSRPLEDRRPPKSQDALLWNMALPLRAKFYPLGFSVEILTNDPEVLNAAAESFGHVLTCRAQTALQVRIGISQREDDEYLPEPTRREYNHLYSLVANANNQAMLDLKSHASFAWLTKSALKNRLYFRHNFLEKMVYLLLGASVVTDLHAACISQEGKGILLCGDSGAGKSTLAYACARSGWTYTSDDTTYLINESPIPCVIGHAHRVRFRPAAKALFPELGPHSITPRMEGKPSIEVPVSKLLSLSTRNEVEVHAVVYLNRHISATPRLISLPQGTAMRRMREDLYSAGEIRAQHEKILDVFSNIPTYELQYCDLQDGIDQLGILAKGL